MAENQKLITATVTIESKAAQIFENGVYKHIDKLPEKNLLDLFKYLIPDWKWMENKVSFYSCSDKRKAIFEVTQSDLIQQIIDMLKIEDKSLFHFYLYRTLHQIIHEITNDEKKSESMKDAIKARRPFEYDQYLKGIKEEFKRCLKLTLVGSSYLFDYSFEEEVTDDKFELLKYLFTCQLSRFELSFGEYVAKEKRNLGAYHQISLKPVVRFYYNIARNPIEKDTRKQYQNIKCQQLIAHSFPEVERNSFLITKFYEQRHLRIFDDSKKYEKKIKKVIWPIILCRVATRLKVLGHTTGVIEKDVIQSQARLLFEEESSNFPFMISDDEMQNFVRNHDFGQSTNVSNYVRQIQANVETLMNLKEPDNRIAIFGRNSARPESLFELILSIPEMATEHTNFIEIIWDKFDLIKTPEMLQVRNHLGKSIFDYIIASDDPWNLIKFIKKLKFHKYFDHEFKCATGLNLFEYYVKLSMLHSGDNRLLSFYVSEIVLYLLEVYDITDLPIETVIDFIEVDYVEKFGIRKYRNVLNPCPQLCLEGKIAADYMLCLMVAYSRPDLWSQEFKRRMYFYCPIVDLLLRIITEPESKCVEGFVESLIKIEDYLANLCFMSEGTQSSNLIALFKSAMFIAAMINNKRNIIDKIFESENFATLNFKFPGKMKTYDGSYYATMKLIDSNYGDVLSKYNFPKSWISAKEFGKKLLDSRITLIDNQKRIEINSTFLINADLKQFNVETENDLDDQLFLRDDPKALQFYYENEGLKEFITHPAIAIYVGLKWFKYKRIFVWNFWIFVLQLISYSLFVFWKIGKNYENSDSDWFIHNPILQNYLQVQTILTIVYMIGREFFQFWNMNKRSFHCHFSTLENIMESLLVVTIACTFLLDAWMSREVLVYLACFNIFVMMLIMITMFPYSFMYFHMQMFRKVAKTFVKFFLTFITLLFTFVIIFAIIFNLILPKSHHGSDTVEIKEFTKNFDNIGKAGSKVILMLSGEYSIDPFDLNVFQLIVFALFVFITYILFNLIVGLTIDDVQKLRENANKVVVRNQIETIVKTDRIFREYYSAISKNVTEQSKTTKFRRILYSIRYRSMKFLFNRYLHLHKIDKIYIDLETLSVDMFIADSFKCPVQFSFWRFDIERFLGQKHLQIDTETFEKLNQILIERCDEEYEINRKNQVRRERETKKK